MLNSASTPLSLTDEPLAQTNLHTRQIDRLYLALITLGLLLASSLPYLFALLTVPDGKVFMGLVLAVADTSQYFAWLREHQSALIISNTMTPEPNEPAFFNLLWWSLAQLMNLTGWSATQVFQLFRIATLLLFVPVLWWFCGLLSANRRERWLATLTVLLGGGLGWIWIVDKYLRDLSDPLFPVDVFTYEPNTFLSLMATPHFVEAAAVMLAIFGLFLLAERATRGAWRYYAGATILALLLGLHHAYDLLIIYFVLGTYVLLQFIQARRILWDRFWGLGAVGLISFPPAGYFTWLTSHNPLWREVLAQFDNAGIFTPPPWRIWILLGLPFLISLAYGISRLRQLPASFARRNSAAPADPRGLFVWTWTVVGFVLLYIPTDFQIHMLNPYQIPLALLSSFALLRHGLPWLARRGPQLRRLAQPRLLGLLLLLAVVPVNLYLLGWRLIDLRRAEVPYFLTLDEVSALNWLESAQAERHAVVLSSEEFGQFIPRESGQRAVIAHWAMTVDFYGKRDAIAAFYGPDSTAEIRRQLIERFDVRYVVYGPHERAFGASEPLDDPYLNLVFRSPNVTIYAVEERDHGNP